MEITPEQIEQVKSQLNDAQYHSHFVIFETYDEDNDETINMVTDYQSYKSIKAHQDSDVPMRIVRDIVPVTDHLAMWAICENKAATADSDEAVHGILNEINKYINMVLVDNKLPTNK